MPRWTTLLLCALLIGSLALVVWKAGPAKAPEAKAPAAASVTDSEALTAKPDAGPVVKKQDAAPPTPFPAPSAALPLPDDAPKRVSFGVILVTFRGAQGAPKDARTHAEARTKAETLMSAARDNFEEAVKKGDPGSTPDAGWIPRGVLEPPIEYVLFTLPKGELYEVPLLTPRGYWILRRTR